MIELKSQFRDLWRKKVWMRETMREMSHRLWFIDYESLARNDLNLMHVKQIADQLFILIIHDYSWLITWSSEFVKIKVGFEKIISESSDLMNCDIFHNRLRDQKSRQRKKNENKPTSFVLTAENDDVINVTSSPA